MNTSLTGVILNIFPDERYGDFIKQKIWVQELGVQWPNTYEVELWEADRLALVHYKTSDVIEIQVELRGKLLTKKFKNEQFVINILKCTGIKKV